MYFTEQISLYLFLNVFEILIKKRVCMVQLEEKHKTKSTEQASVRSQSRRLFQ